MSNPSSLENLAKWLEEHQDKETKVILLDSKHGNIYSFEAAFSFFVLEGDIDLSTNEIANGTLYITVPVWGRVNLVEDIAGNLGNSVTSQFSRGPNLNGHFTLSLDKNTNKLIIDYDIDLRFVGNVSEKIALFTLPDSADSSAGAAREQPTAKFTMAPDAYKLFDKFLDEHFDEETHNFNVTTYTPSAAGTGLSGGKFAAGVSSNSKGYPLYVAFLGIFEIEGTIDPATLDLDADLYVRVPLWGRVRITTISGNLKEGIKTEIDLLVAKGTFGLKLVHGNEVWTEVDLDVKFIGRIKEDIKLFDLPF